MHGKKIMHEKKSNDLLLIDCAGGLSMALNQEDVSFLIYASVLKGYSIPNAVSAVVATVLDSTGRLLTFLSNK